MTLSVVLAALAAGVAIGLVLGLVGGGGSILAVPLLVYGVGLQSTHAAIGTAAVAVALNAALGLAGHARAGHVKWNCALVFAASGILGAAAGAELGKIVDGKSLLIAFGLLMIGVGIAMLVPRTGADDPGVHLTRTSAGHLLPRLVPAGGGVGLAAGFFGIGGGFLIVPALRRATAMPMVYAVGSSLVAIVAMGATTAASYAVSGYVRWDITALLVLGGALGAVAGLLAGARLEARKGVLERLFALLVIAVGAFVALG